MLAGTCVQPSISLSDPFADELTAPSLPPGYVYVKDLGAGTFGEVCAGPLADCTGQPRCCNLGAPS